MKVRGRISRIFIAFVLTVALLVPCLSGSVLAYNYSTANAIYYADKYWNSYNTGIYINFEDLGLGDCTNYVSQILRAGGLPMVSGKWYWGNRWNYTNSWSVADNLKNYLKNDVGAYRVASGWAKKEQRNAQGIITHFPYPDKSANLLGNGSEVIFYDWTGDGYMDHSAYCVRIGQDPNSYYYDKTIRYGQKVNQHSKNRYDAIWHLDPYNNDRDWTEVYGFRV